uniref:Type III-B CRISPR module RAMP protein Cmr4 n=1 Tax=Desulfacinum infernum TaxID=35837 RepID=A0A831ZZA9_9BACT
MYKTAKLMWIYTEHPVHAGAGTGVGAIDLPIQREAVTGWPIIQASGLKGCLREHFEFLAVKKGDTVGQQKIVEAFGHNAAEHGGALAFADAKMLIFPVRSMRGTFAYVTCPLALQRLKRELESIEQSGGQNLALGLDLETDRPTEEHIWVASGKNNTVDSDLTIAANQSHLVGLEELSFTAEPKSIVETLGDWLEKNAGSLPWLKNGPLHTRLAVVSDNHFKDFVEMSTEVVTRNRIDDATKTVAKGMLWTEEHLPRECVLYAAVFASDPFVASSARQCADATAVMNFFANDAEYTPKRVWLGGDVTVGRGLVHLAFA